SASLRMTGEGRAVPHRTRIPPSIPLEVRVPGESLDIVRDEGVRLLPRQPGRPVDLLPEGRDQRLRVELHIVQDLRDGVAVYEVGDLVGVSIAAEAEVHGVRIPEQIVQIAEDLLVGAGEEDPQDVLVAVLERVKLEGSLLRTPAG